VTDCLIRLGFIVRESRGVAAERPDRGAGAFMHIGHRVSLHHSNVKGTETF
jgi:hypothetical protein